MSEFHSVGELVRQLRDDESEAVRQLWDRFIDRLIAAAARGLRDLPRRAVDEEDVALSAFDAFVRGVKANRFERLNSNDDLWQVMAMLAERKAVDVLRKELAEKRGKGQVRGESVFENMFAESSAGGGINQVGDPDPEAVEAFASKVRRLLESLEDDRLREIAILRLEGYSNLEIAERLEIALRAVERKLQLIRQKWGA